VFQKKWLRGFTLIELMVVVVIVGIIGSLIYTAGYKFFSRKEFIGKVTACSNMSMSVVAGRSAGGGLPSGTFSFAVDLDIGNEVVTFSSEDRQFANVVKGDSVEVAVFRYAPWQWDKAGTYCNGRLLRKYKPKS
jgi:prepilin-type N-terminal cleavage/methylation domain-containing protein